MARDVGGSRRSEREAFYRRISAENLAPLWEVLGDLVPPSPRSACQPAFWSYEAVRPWVIESGSLISAREATRRVLVLENPGLPGESRITTSLYAGLQLLLPGEVAPAHRHTQSALRFVLEGRGAFTTVEGEPAYMERGDLVLTPSWTWHDHGSEGGEPTIWLDGLDIPVHSFLGTAFREDLGAAAQQPSRPPGDVLARFGANLVPVDHRPEARACPLFVYPYARTREALARMSAGGPADACHGFKLRYVNPTTGDHVLPTIAAFVQLLPKGFRSAWYHSTDATVFVPIEGSGRSTVGDRAFDWRPRDVFVVPSWAPVRHEALEESVVFSFSDRAIQEKLGAWREERGP
jgi:gentisate 1,2-dioxygenase